MTRRIVLSEKSAAKIGLKSKRSKYGVRMDPEGKARRTLDGILFDSCRECERYSELKLLEKSHAIAGLELQPRFDLEINGQHICEYRADFRYTDLEPDYKEVVEDVKSSATKTAVYKLKKKLVKAIHGVEIQEL